LRNPDQTLLYAITHLFKDYSGSMAAGLALPFFFGKKNRSGVFYLFVDY